MIANMPVDALQEKYLGAVPEPDNKHWYPERSRFVAATTMLDHVESLS
jgi:hypothetical protein